MAWANTMPRQFMSGGWLIAVVAFTVELSYQLNSKRKSYCHSELYQSSMQDTSCGISNGFKFVIEWAVFNPISSLQLRLVNDSAMDSGF